MANQFASFNNLRRVATSLIVAFVIQFANVQECLAQSDISIQLFPAPTISSPVNGFQTVFPSVDLIGVSEPLQPIYIHPFPGIFYGTTSDASGNFVLNSPLDPGTNLIRVYVADNLLLPISAVASVTVERLDGTDTDRDGIPDLLDTCPRWRNPFQTGPCGRDLRVLRGSPLDADNDGVTDLQLYETSAGSYFFSRTNSSEPLPTTIPIGYRRSKPAAGDYNGDGTSDVAVVDTRPTRLLWLTKFSNGRQWRDSFGIPGDFAITGCQLNRNAATDMAYLRGKTVFIRTMHGRQTTQISLENFKELLPIGCVDINSDGIDELAIRGTRKGADSRTSPNLFLIDYQGSVKFSMRASRVKEVFLGDWEEDGIVELVLLMKNDLVNDKLIYIDKSTKRQVGSHEIPANAKVTSVDLGTKFERIDRAFYWVDPILRSIESWGPVNFTPVSPNQLAPGSELVRGVTMFTTPPVD